MLFKHICNPYLCTHRHFFRFRANFCNLFWSVSEDSRKHRISWEEISIWGRLGCHKFASPLLLVSLAKSWISFFTLECSRQHTYCREFSISQADLAVRCMQQLEKNIGQNLIVESYKTCFLRKSDTNFWWGGWTTAEFWGRDVLLLEQLRLIKSNLI